MATFRLNQVGHSFISLSSSMYYLDEADLADNVHQVFASNVSFQKKDLQANALQPFVQTLIKILTLMNYLFWKTFLDLGGQALCCSDIFLKAKFISHSHEPIVVQSKLFILSGYYAKASCIFTRAVCWCKGSQNPSGLHHFWKMQIKSISHIHKKVAIMADLELKWICNVT